MVKKTYRMDLESDLVERAKKRGIKRLSEFVTEKLNEFVKPELAPYKCVNICNGLECGVSATLRDWDRKYHLICPSCGCNHRKTKFRFLTRVF